MTIDQCIAETKARIEAWESVGQREHAEALRREMWRILGPFAPARISEAA
jgi:hypothetical protein